MKPPAPIIPADLAAMSRETLLWRLATIRAQWRDNARRAMARRADKARVARLRRKAALAAAKRAKKAASIEIQS